MADNRPRFRIESLGAKHLVIENDSDLIMRTLDSYAEAQAWIKAVLA